MRFLLFSNLFIFAYALNTGFSTQDTTKLNNTRINADSLSRIAKIDTVLKKAYSVLGTPYKWAGATPKTGFDCSGFVYWCFKHVGVSTARSSSGLYNHGKKIDIENAEAGDLILFRGTNPKSKGVGHVGIVTSKKGQPLTFIHSSSSKQHWGVIETVYGASYYTKRFVGIRRVL